MMNSQEAMLIPMRTAETILEEIEEMYDEITSRAREISRERAGSYAPDLEDWLAAEQQLLLRPEVRVQEKDRQITVTICLGMIRPLDVQLLVTPDAMVIQAEDGVTAKKVFRTVEFPRRIDVKKAEARYANGYLILTA
jgi:HSP20 family molecular chaperone IbpA